MYMKITLLKQNIKDEGAITRGMAGVVQALNSINFPITVIVKPTTRIFTSMAFENTTIGKGNCIVPEQILAEVDGTDDIAFLLFSNKNIVPPPLNPVHTPIKKGNTTPCQMCEEWYNDFDNVFEEFFLHEMCHAIYFLVGQSANDKTHFKYDPSWNNQFNQKTNIEYYLFLITILMPAWNTYKAGTTPMPTYKYFKSSEVVGLQDSFVKKLDQARGIAGVPFIISSGYRDAKHNTEVGGVPDSSHESGLAVDLLVRDPVSGEKINAALHQVGLQRFGYYQDGHIHVDDDLSKPHPCFWVK